MSSDLDRGGGSLRGELRSEVRRGAALLSALIDAPHGLLGIRTSGTVAAARAEVVRLLDEPETVVSVMGARADNALLDTWLGRPLLSHAPLDGVLVELRKGTELSYRAHKRDGTTEEARESDRREPLPTPRRGGWLDVLRAWWQRIVAWLSRSRALPKPEERDGGRELAARLRGVLAEGNVLDLHVSSPHATFGAHVVIVDVRGAADRTEASGADACLFVLDGPDAITPPMVEAAQRRGAGFPHLLVRARADAGRVSRALGIDPNRLLVSAFEGDDLPELAENERVLGASVRCVAAIRIAVSAIDDALARDADRDREAIEKAASHGVDDPAAFRAAALEELRGPCAGRAVRILESAASVLARQISRLRAECASAVESAGTRQEILDHVAAVAPAVRRAYDAVEATAWELADAACAEQMPGVFRPLEQRAGAVAAELSAPAGPLDWPPVPQLDPDRRALITSETLKRDDLLHADMKWSDGILRSLEKVKQRSTAQLTEQLEALDREAQAEILASEPHVAEALLETLGAWLDAAVAELTRWIGDTLEAEEQARAAARAKAHASLIAEREALTECATRLNAVSRSLATRSHELVAAAQGADPGTDAAAGVR